MLLKLLSLQNKYQLSQKKNFYSPQTVKVLKIISPLSYTSFKQSDSSYLLYFTKNPFQRNIFNELNIIFNTTVQNTVANKEEGIDPMDPKIKRNELQNPQIVP